MKVVYFVHDLNDPAVHRRIQMLRAADVDVTLLGFSRGAPPAGLEANCLGHTQGGRLGQRVAAVLRAALTMRHWRNALIGADVILARQLETLVLANRARDQTAPNARLIYECLDVHRLMVDPGPKGRLLRLLEARLLRRCEGLIVSSPEFIRSHFAARYRDLPPVHLVENKVLGCEVGGKRELEPMRGVARPAGPPWRIGWFGVIRCQRSLDLLAALVRSQRGKVEVIIRGRIARDVLPDFDTVIASTPGLRYLGPYDRRNELGTIYRGVHFAWAIDYFEAGANSDWLLPNRIYEGGLFGAIPIARNGCATAAWLQGNGIGVILDGDPEPALTAFFGTLDQARTDHLTSVIRTRPLETFLYTDKDCADLMQAVVSTGRS